MEVKVCKNCRRLFKYSFGPELCPECSKLITKEKQEQNDQEITRTLKPMLHEDEEKYKQVKDYIMAHPRASIIQISEANDIIPGKLLEWIREDRLEFSRESEYAWFACEKCGAKIRSGRLCNRCRSK